MQDMFSLYPDDMILDPNYQNNLFMIENALQDVGAIEKPAQYYPNVFDDQLMRLIDSVPLE